MWLWGVFFYGQAFPMAIMSNIMYFFNYNKYTLQHKDLGDNKYYPSLKQDV